VAEIELYHAYERFKLPPDADQEEIRRVYVQLRQELDGEDLRRLYAAWESLLSPQNRVRVDAMLLQVDGTPPGIDELLAQIGPAADITDWNSFIDHAALLQRETETVTSLILEHTWLGHAYSKIFTREAPVAEQWPLPQANLTPVTHAARPVPSEEGVPTSDRPPRRPSLFRPAWAGALLTVLLLTFTSIRSGWFSSPNAITTTMTTAMTTAAMTTAAMTTAAMTTAAMTTAAMTTAAMTTAAMTVPTTQSLGLVMPIAAYDAPSRSFIVPTPTPLGQRPILVVQATPPPALTAPITSAALIDQLRERLERTTEIVETNETEFARSISFGSVQPAPRLPVAPPLMLRPSSVSPPVTPTVSPLPSPTLEPTATAIPLLVQSLNFANVRSGPSTEFDVVEVLEPETSRRVLARTQSAAWLFIETTNGEGGWISTSVVDVNGDVGSVEIQDSPLDLEPTP
jgi:hypothetical protein